MNFQMQMFEFPNWIGFPLFSTLEHATSIRVGYRSIQNAVASTNSRPTRGYIPPSENIVRTTALAPKPEVQHLSLAYPWRPASLPYQDPSLLTHRIPTLSPTLHQVNNSFMFKFLSISGLLIQSSAGGVVGGFSVGLKRRSLKLNAISTKYEPTKVFDPFYHYTEFDLFCVQILKMERFCLFVGCATIR